MGNVPRNSDCAGCVIITAKMSGYSRYRRTWMDRNTPKSSTFNAKKTIESQYSHLALYGSVFSRIETIPVPMFTENHLSALSELLL